MLKSTEMLDFLYKNNLKLVEKMKKCSHNYNDGIYSKYHLEDSIWTHTMMVLKTAELFGFHYEERIACLLHDIGKTLTRQELDQKKQKVRFIGHSGISFFLAIDILNKMNLSIASRQYILSLIALHGKIFENKFISKEGAINDKKILERFINNSELLKGLIDISWADIKGRFNIEETRDLPEWTRFQLKGLMPQIKEKPPLYNGSKEITFLIGLPASGKTNFRHMISEDCVVLSKDDIRFEITGAKTHDEAFYKANKEIVDALFLDKLIETTKKEKNIIIDNMNLSRKSRKKWLKHTRGYAKRAFLFLTPFEELLRRNKKREIEENKTITTDDMIELMKKFQLPMYDEFDLIHWIWN